MGQKISWVPDEGCDKAKEDELEGRIPGQFNSTSSTEPSAIHADRDVNVSGGTFNVAGRDNIYIENHYHALPPPDTTNLLEILKWLSPNVNFRAIQVDTFDKATPGTGLWFLDSDLFQDWLKSEKGIVWGTGIPGAGKTVLASIIIEELQKLERGSPDVSVAIAYCRYTDAIPVREILAALVRQQLERHPAELIAIIEPIFERHRRENTHPSQNELLALLKAISKKFKTIFFVLDGLDEVPHEHQFDLIKALSSIDAHFVITSRPLDVLKSELPDAKFFNIVAQERDIELFINNKIDRSPRFRDLLERHTGSRQEVITKICEKARGMFLHAALQVETLRYCTNIKTLLERLEKLPVKIEDMYADTIKRIDMQPEDDIRLAKLVLLWLLYSRKSMSINELQYAIASSDGPFDPSSIVDPSIMASVCCGLVTVDSHSGLARLIHYSASGTLKRLLEKEFLHPHATIAEACISRLVTCEIPKSNLKRKRDLDKSFKENPFLEYAYDNWSQHVTASDTVEHISDIVSNFLSQCEAYPCHLGGNNNWRLEYLTPLHIAARCNLSQLLVKAQAEGASSTRQPDLIGGETTVNFPTKRRRMTPLMLASQYGNDAAVQRLLEHPDVDINAVAQDGSTALILAVQRGHMGVFGRLIKVPGIQVNLKRKDGNTALLVATCYSQEAIALELLDFSGVDVNSKSKDGCTALVWAAYQDQEVVVRRMLQFDNIEVNAIPEDGRTALMEAAHYGYTQVVKLLLSHPGILVNVADLQGVTALMAACECYPEFDTIQALLEAPGIDVNHQGDEGETALSMTVECGAGFESVLQLLLSVPDINVNLQTNEGRTALMDACEEGHELVVQQLLDVPWIQVNLVDEDGRTALLEACEGGHVGIVARLLENQEIEVNLPAEDGWTALMAACEKGNQLIVQKLLDFAGIQVDLQAHDGETALMMACEEGHDKVVRLLLEVPGIQVNMVDDKGQTALMIASSNGRHSTVGLLLGSPEIEVNLPAEDGQTALTVAARGGHEFIVEQLLTFPGAEVLLGVDNVSAAVTAACDGGHDKIVQMLLAFIEAH